MQVEIVRRAVEFHVGFALGQTDRGVDAAVGGVAVHGGVDTQCHVGCCGRTEKVETVSFCRQGTAYASDT